MKNKADILIEVFRAAGSAAAVARHIGLTRAAVSDWKIVPVKYLRQISDLTGISRERLRPDLYE